MKPHGALNNIACEDINVAKAIIRGFKTIDRNLILLAPGLFMAIPLYLLKKMGYVIQQDSILLQKNVRKIY